MKLDEAKLQMILAEKQMRLKDLYERSGVSDRALLDLRKGKTTPRPATIGRIAKALNVEVQDIIQEED